MKSVKITGDSSTAEIAEKAMVILFDLNERLQGFIGHDHEPIPRHIHHQGGGERSIEGNDTFIHERIFENLFICQMVVYL